MSLEELKKKADELKVGYKEDTSEDDLKKLIEDKEKQLEDEKKKDADYWKTEAEKAFEKRDSAKSDARSLKRKLTDMQKQLENAPNMEEFKSLREELNELREFKTEQQKAEEEKALKDKSEAEKMEIRLKKQMEEQQAAFERQMEEQANKFKETEEQLTELQQRNKELTFKTLENEIFEAASKNHAYNPAQIVRLLKSEFTYDDKLDKFVFEKRNDRGKLVDELTVDERIQDFLSEESNANLVKSKTSNATFNTQKDDTSSNKRDASKQKLGKHKKYDPEDPKLLEAAERAGYSDDLNEYIKLQITKDLKLGNISKEEHESQMKAFEED